VNAPRRILYVSSSAQVAGAENSLLQLLGALDRRGYAPVAALPGTGPLEAQLAALGVPVLHAPIPRLRRTIRPWKLAATGAREAAAVLRLRGEIRRRGIDLVHASGLSALAAGGPAAALAGVPCLWHLRDLRFPRWAARVIGRFADAMVAVSRAVAEAEARGAEVIHNAIDAEAFAARARPGALRAELDLTPDTPLALVVSQMVPWKGHVRFLRAMAEARRRCPGAVAAVAGSDLFGDHPGYEEGLRALADELGPAGSVRFLGQRDDVPTLMADADVLVVPSNAEPFGRVALEAMALGTPVAGLARGGLPEVVEDGVTGCLAPTGAPAVLGEMIARLLDDAKLRALMGVEARRTVAERFGVAEHAARVSAVYERLLR